MSRDGLLVRRFQAGKIGVLFFSRGRGRGHALPDLELVEWLVSEDRLIDWKFVSYGTGLETLTSAGWPAINLGLPENNPFLATVVRAEGVVRALQPDLVVSHEEFAALPAAQICGVPSLLLVDWFPPAGSVWEESLAYADQVLFLENNRLFEEPRVAEGRVQYAGPIIRQLQFECDQREAVRQDHWAVKNSTFVVGVIPGAWATEERMPIAEELLSAFDLLPESDKLLIWNAGADFSQISALVALRANVRVIESCAPIEKLMVACDVVVTKSNRGTLQDLACLGIPTVSLSRALNPIDEAYAPSFPGNESIDLNSSSPQQLMQALLAQGRLAHSTDSEWQKRREEGVAPVAQAVRQAIHELSRFQPSQSQLLSLLRRKITKKA